ncbi:MAG: hypothetical protein IKR74_00245 [Bacilli bacterium]|nr:hypothetical protein [Bacilli bacterium]
MNELREVLNSYLYFGVVFAVFLVFLAYVLLFVSGKKKRKSYYLFGLLLDFSNGQVLALSLIIINFLLLVYTLLFKIKLSISFALVSLLLILIAFAVIKSAKYLLINGTINLVNLGYIYLANLVNTLRLENTAGSYILQIMINVLGVLFYLFTSLKFFRNIQGKEYQNEKNS